MSIKEVIRTSGDVRRVLAQGMVDIRSGELSVDKGSAMAQLAKEINHSIQVELNVHKLHSAMLKEGRNLGKLTHLGKMLIEDEGTVPTLSGIEG